jgi:hypothetical protein
MRNPYGVLVICAPTLQGRHHGYQDDLKSSVLLPECSLSSYNEHRLGKGIGPVKGFRKIGEPFQHQFRRRCILGN